MTYFYRNANFTADLRRENRQACSNPHFGDA